jgi:hypothetical protein
MGTVNHSALQPPNNHGAFNLIYRTEADRVAGTNEVNSVTLTAANIGQLAKQLDNGYYYELLTVSPSIAWRQVTGGVKQKTTEDIDIWISTTGSDTTGDGSASTPYATFTRAFREIQDLDLRHKVTIHPAAGTYTEFPTYLDLTIGPSGCLVIDASGETSPVSAGSFTVAAVTGVGQPDLFGTELATDLQVSGAPGWTPDEHYGYFAHVLTGNWAGYLVPIWKNTADTIRTYFDWNTFQIGDTFEIVSCPVVIDIDHEVQIKGSIPGEDLFGQNKPQFLVAGIQFEIDTGSQTIMPMFFNDISVIMSFCVLKDVWDSNSNSIPLGRKNSDLNYTSVPVGAFANDKLETFFTHAFMILSMNGAPPTANGFDMAIYGSGVLEGTASVQCRRSIFVQGDGAALFWVMAGGYNDRTVTTGKSATVGLVTIDHLYIEQIGWTDTALKCSAHTIAAELIMIESCNLPVSLNDGANMIVGWLKGTTVGNAYAVELKRGSQMHITSTTHVTILGTTGAVKFKFDNTTHATWPVTKNFYSKVNSYVVSE